MDYLTITPENLPKEHICCGFTSKESAVGYQLKKDWLKAEMELGYTFRKADARGKVFIEYVPIEQSWLPLQGSNFTVINCFWVSGQFKGKGHGKQLLEFCKQDSAQRDGMVAVTSDKKRPFMSDPVFLKRQGFEIIDEAPPYFKLWGLKTNANAQFPRFKDTARKGVCPDKEGISIYYSNTCPFTEHYAKNFMPAYAERKGVPLKVHHINSRPTAQKMPIPWIIFSVFYQGELVTLEVKPDRHLDKLLG